MQAHGRIAQSVERGANNAAVQGSSPCMTIILLSRRGGGGWCSN